MRSGGSGAEARTPQGPPGHPHPTRQFPLTQRLEQKRAIEGEDEWRQVLQAHYRQVTVDPYHLVSR